MNSLVQALYGITFGQIARGDVDNVRRELQKIFSGKMRKKLVHVADERKDKDDNSLPQNRHTVVNLPVYCEQVYALVDSGAIPNVM